MKNLKYIITIKFAIIFIFITSFAMAQKQLSVDSLQNLLAAASQQGMAATIDYGQPYDAWFKICSTDNPSFLISNYYTNKTVTNLTQVGNMANKYVVTNNGLSCFYFTGTNYYAQTSKQYPNTTKGWASFWVSATVSNNGYIFTASKPGSASPYAGVSIYQGNIALQFYGWGNGEMVKLVLLRKELMMGDGIMFILMVAVLVQQTTATLTEPTLRG